MGLLARKQEMQPLVLNVYVTYDEGDGMWVAVSDDIPGLATEAKTFAKLVERVKAVAPELLRDNLEGFDSCDIPVAFMQSHYTSLHVG